MTVSLVGGPLDGACIELEFPSTRTITLESEASGAIYRYDLVNGKWEFSGVIDAKSIQWTGSGCPADTENSPAKQAPCGRAEEASDA
jgi:hypothetical protein